MKAIRIHGYGGPEVLRLEDISRPSPGPGELLIKVHAASVNPVDWNVRQGHMQQFLPLKLPAVLGWDPSGKPGRDRETYRLRPVQSVRRHGAIARGSAPGSRDEPGRPHPR